MANRELFIIFVYDTQRCQREEDDPQEAVLYFHPRWVSDQQRLALCGQLMGATHFFITSFSCPRIVALNSGKFIIRQYGRYILTIGTDRNIPDWVLDHRSNTLNQLIQFYHRDLETVASEAGSDANQFSHKLSQMFETYIPILPYAANMFGNIPTIRLPKSASNIFLEAVQILHCCREKSGVLGGSVLFQNKVVASQLNSELTKRLVSSDPCRIKSAADSVSTSFHLPIGVQLLHVYVESKEFYKLQRNSAAARAAYDNVSKRKMALKKVQYNKVPPQKESLTSMKRDVSRIFTVVEEKEGETEQAEDFSTSSNKETNEARALPSDFTTSSNEEFNGAHILPSDFTFSRNSSTVTHENSECPTPLKDININKVLHAKVMSICSKTSGDTAEEQTVKDASVRTDLFLSSKVQNITNIETKTEKHRKKKIKPFSYVVNCNENDVRSLSVNDLQQTPRKSSNRVPMRYYSFGLPRLTREMTDDSDDYSPVKKLPVGKHYCNTIADPLHPLFRDDGLAISRSLYNENLARHYRLLDLERTEELSPGDDLYKVSFTDVLSTTETSDNITEQYEMTSNIQNSEPSDAKPLQEQSDSCLDGDISTKQQLEQVGGTSSKQEMYRRSLSLPLKTMTSGDYEDEEMRRRSTSYTSGVLESPSVRMKTLGGLQLTPLMSKLSLLAMEEKTSGFCSRDTTPGEFRDLSFPGTSNTSSVPEQTRRKIGDERREAELEQEENKEYTEASKKAVLYVFCQQNMSLLLLLEEGLGQDPADLIHSLWETSVNSLPKLEIHLRHCLEHFPQGEGMDSYSFLCLDPNWDMMQRGGVWASTELEVVACIHNDFVKSQSLTEVVVRCEDSTVYGYQCGKTEVFYQQSTGNTVGLPTPSDLMGVVPLKARRRLERDHSIVLL